MSRRDIVGHVSAGGEWVSVLSSCRQADDGVLPRRKQTEAQGQRQFEVAAKSLAKLAGHIADKVQIELFVDRKPMGRQFADLFHHLRTIATNEE